MSLSGKIAATALFDFRRSLTVGRMSVVAVLSLFPPAIIAINLPDPGPGAAPIIIGVTVMMVGILAELLWASPIVHGELEGKTWLFLAVRPRGVIALLLGKYLVAVLWTFTVCSIALAGSVLLAAIADIPDTARMWLVFQTLIVLASFAYAAIFTLLGVLFHRRAMVFSMAYVIVFEMLIAQIPAIINQLTIRHHLTALAVKWLDFADQFGLGRDPFVDEMLGLNESDWQNFIAIVLTTAAALLLSLRIISDREYLFADDV